MTDFNPNNPDIVGLEWFPARFRAVALTPTLHYGAEFPAGASESIQYLRSYILGTGTAALDIYDLANPFLAPVTTVMALPGSDFSHADGWVRSDSGTINPYGLSAYQNVDDPIPASVGANPGLGASTQLIYAGINPSLVAQILFRGRNTGEYDGEDGSLGVTLVGKRILKVAVVTLINNANSAANTRFDGYLNIDALRYSSTSGPIVVVAGTGWQRYRFEWPKNPSTGKPWLLTEAQALVDGVHDAFGIGVTAKGNLGNFAVDSVAIEFTVVPENRVATGTVDIAPGWNTFELLDPDTAAPANWAKVSGHTYVLAMRQVAGNPTLAIVDPANVLDHQRDVPPGGWLGVGFQTEGGGPKQLPVTDIWLPAITMLTAGSTLGADAQPYVTPAALFVDATSGNCRQSLAPHATDNYGMIRTALAVNFVGGVPQIPDAPLVITVHNAGTNAQVGGSVSIAPSEVAADGFVHALVRRLSSAASLASGTSYYLQFATASTIPWAVIGTYTGAVEDATHAATPRADLAAPASVGGHGTWDGFDADTLDVMVTLGTVPSPPGGLAATVGEKTLNPAPPGGPAKLKYAALNWNTTALAAKFGYYELQRFDDATWNTIAKITAEAESDYADVECLRGVAQQYRVRVVRADGAPSDWTT